MPPNHTPQSDAAFDAEVDAILAELDTSIRGRPTDADVKADAEADIAELGRVLDSL